MKVGPQQVVLIRNSQFAIRNVESQRVSVTEKDLLEFSPEEVGPQQVVLIRNSQSAIRNPEGQRVSVTEMRARGLRSMMRRPSIVMIPLSCRRARVLVTVSRDVPTISANS